MVKMTSNDCQDFGGAKEPKTDLYKNAAKLLNTHQKPSHVENDMIEPHLLSTNAVLDASL